MQKLKEKILNSVLLFLMFFIILWNSYSYNIDNKEYEKINKIISILNIEIEKKWVVYKNILENKLNFELNKYEAWEKNYEIIKSILFWVSKNITNLDKKVLNNWISNLIVYNWITNEEIDNLLLNNKDKINKNDNIFLFRQKENISMDTIYYITKRIYELNPNIRIFVDQEGGLVNRYNIFDSNHTFDLYIQEDEILNQKYHKLSDNLKTNIKNSFKNKLNFISAKKIWEIFNKIETEKEKQNFLDFISFFELFTNLKAWINTYWLVLDLDMWNPAISWNQRAFSKDVDANIMYWNYYVKNSKALWISLYLKHYLWHWAWKIDTHNSILEYSLNDKEYIENNLRVFEMVIKTAKDIKHNIWLMVGHMLVPLEYKNRFLWNLWEVDFVLTDDLWMWAYKESKDKKFENKFFTSNEILKYGDIIEVSTSINQIK